METIPNGLDLEAHKKYLASERGQKRYNFGAVFPYPDPKTLPLEFMYTPLEIKDQTHGGEYPLSDFCGAFAGSSSSELQEGVLLEPSWLMQKTKQIMGDVQSFGVDPESLAQAMKQGGLEQKDSPFSLATHDPQFLRNPMNWDPKYDTLAAKHAKQAFYWIDPMGKLDMFDVIRGAIYLFRNEKRSVDVGMDFAPEWVGLVDILKNGSHGSGHMMNCIGWKIRNGQPILAIQQSYGRYTGEEGVQYFSREVVNKFPVALMFADKPDNLTHEDITRLSQMTRVNFLYKLFLEIVRQWNEWLKNNGLSPA